MRLAVLAVTVVTFGVGRFTLVKHHDPSAGGSFEAAAHLVVGGLIGAALSGTSHRAAYWTTAAVLSAVEVVAFIVTR